MRAVIFFVCLCALLLKGYDHVHTGVHHLSVGYYAAEKKQQEKHAATRQASPFIKDGAEQQEADDLLCEAIEDDENDAFGKKLKWLTIHPLAPPRTFLLNYLYGYPKDPLPCGSLLSYKYITQRALRI